MYTLDTFITHEFTGRAFRNKFEVRILGDTDIGIPLRVQSVIFDNIQVTGDYLESIKRYTVSNVTIPKTLTLSALEMIDFSTYRYLLEWVGKIYDIERNVFITGADANTVSGRRRTISIEVDKPVGVSRPPLKIEVSGIPLYIPNPSFDWKDGAPITLDSITIGIDSFKVYVQGDLVR